MNPYQKFGTFAVRIVGMVMAIYGGLSLIVIALAITTLPFPGVMQLLLNIPMLLIVVGIGLFVQAARIGEHLGADLG